MKLQESFQKTILTQSALNLAVITPPGLKQIPAILHQQLKVRKTNYMIKSDSTRLDIYVNYPGHCEEAFRFYEKHLGGKIISMMKHEELPSNPNLPETWRKAILHARMELGNTVLMGADIPHAEPMRSAYLTLRFNTDKEAERVYSVLSEGGEIFMKMEETFYASRFAMLRDKFGTSWMLLCEK